MKKIFFIIMILILLVFKINNLSDAMMIPVINCINVEATAYNNTVNQCNEEPNITAFGYRINDRNRDFIVAVSRDLLPILPKKTRIYFEHNNEIHKKIVFDKMSRFALKGTRKRFKIEKSIDILLRSHREAKHFGRINKTIYWFGGMVSCEIYKENVILTRRHSNSKLIKKILDDNNIKSSFIIVNNL